MKLLAMISYITDKMLFGNVEGYGHIVMFQKPGLPGGHFVSLPSCTSKQRLNRSENEMN